MLAVQPADAAAEREPGNTAVADEPTRRRESERLRLVVELAPEHTGVHPRCALLRVDPNALHQPQVDDDAAVAHRVAGIAVPPAAHGDGTAGVAREPDSSHHVGHAARQRAITVGDRSMDPLQTLRWWS
jgi:hypothetical protein